MRALYRRGDDRLTFPNHLRHAGRVSQAPTQAPASLWRHYDFRQLWIGDTISQVGTPLSALAIPVLAVQVLAAGEREMGVLTALETLAFLVIGLPAGAWVDRWRKKRVLVANDVVRAALLASLPLAWAFDVLTLGQLYVVATALGIATVFFDVAYQSYLPSLVAATQVVDGNAKLEASRAVAQIGGPALGGGLLRFLNPVGLVALDAVTFLASAVFVARIRHRETAPARADRRPLREEVAEGLRFVLRHTLLRRIVACTSLSNFFHAMTAALLALFVLRDLELDAAVLGLVFSASAVGGLVGALATKQLAGWVGEGRAIGMSALAAIPFLALTPLASTLAGSVSPVAVLVVGGVGTWFTIVVYNITQVSFRQRVCPPALLGRMNASVRFLVWGVQPLGALAGGFLGEAFGIVPTLWVAVAGGCIAALPVVLSPLMSMRTLPGPQTDTTNA
jgi:MFS family permease